MPITLLQDTFETFWDARVDLWERRLRRHGKKVLESTHTALKKRGIEGDAFAKDLDKELSRYKAQVKATARHHQWRMAYKKPNVASRPNAGT